MTIQAHAEDADINVMMRRYGITGKMPDNPRIPTYGDFSNITDYRGALDAVRNANEAFMEIPADVRARFDNDPQLFLEFCSNPSNLDSMRQLGLAKQLPQAPPAAGATPPAAPGAAAPGAAPPQTSPPATKST